MLIQLTAFNPLDHRDAEPMMLESHDVKSIIPCRTPDGYDYTAVTVDEAVFSVKERLQVVRDKVEEGNADETR
jgi:hypothetical protein